MIGPYPKRLIEVELPIARISEHARREKRQGHISSLHIWWARRPLAACRAVILASLWPDPVDLSEWSREGEEVVAPRGCKPGQGIVVRPERFLLEARQRMTIWARIGLGKASAESGGRLIAVQKNAEVLANPAALRAVLVDFIADFSNWDNSTDPEYLDIGRALTQAAHEALGGAPGTRPLVVDSFAGGGSIPLEALRVGADAFASDLNPVAVLLNKVILEDIPQYGHRLADEARKWGEWVRFRAEEEMSEFYPKDSPTATPIVYLWARTIRCEGPGCGAEVPVTRSLWIDRSRDSTYALLLEPTKNGKSLSPTVVRGPKPRAVKDGTSKRGSVTCPCCGYTTARRNVEAQSKTRGLGQQLLAVAVDAHSGRTYRSPIARDFKACALAEARLRELSTPGTIPSEPLPYLRSIFNVHVYGLQEWSALFSPRQLLYLTTLVRLVTTAPLAKSGLPEREQVALRALLALAASKSAMLNCNVARWRGDKGRLEGAFAMQALPMVWDWGELNPLNRRMMPFGDLVEAIAKVVDQVARAATNTGTVAFGSATALPLPDDCAAAFITDPPYYDSIPYANLSDFPFVWLKRLLRSDYPALFSLAETPKTDEIVQLAERNVLYAHKTREFFENSMEQALAEARRIAQPSGIACIVFAHKTTVGWEALVNAVLRSGWTVTASWPIDTELTTRFKAIGTASLSSSIHLLCRPRENLEDSGGGDRIGNWRDVLGELPQRIHEWMPRLAEEGVVGADAIFACLGPALEIFSRYLRVEKASGEVVALKEYLEQVWAAVAKEALTMVFAGADATGFEPGARLTAMWLWTLSAGKPGSADGGDSESDEESDDEVDGSSKKTKMIGFVLEYDAARKIAQGLGANLEGLESLVEVSGETARLLAVGERIDYLFRKDPVGGVEGRRTRTKKPRQGSLFEEVEASEMGDGVAGGGIERSRAETTILDRVHQSMILFGAGRGEALKRFLIEDGVGMDARFWRLADALAALYPRGTDERRWVEGVLARKKGLGF